MKNRTVAVTALLCLSMSGCGAMERFHVATQSSDVVQVLATTPASTPTPSASGDPEDTGEVTDPCDYSAHRKDLALLGNSKAETVRALSAQSTKWYRPSLPKGIIFESASFFPGVAPSCTNQHPVTTPGEITLSHHEDNVLTAKHSLRHIYADVASNGQINKAIMVATDAGWTPDNIGQLKNEVSEKTTVSPVTVAGSDALYFTTNTDVSAQEASDTGVPPHRGVSSRGLIKPSASGPALVVHTRGLSKAELLTLAASINTTSGHLDAPKGWLTLPIGTLDSLSGQSWEVHYQAPRDDKSPLRYVTVTMGQEYFWSLDIFHSSLRHPHSPERIYRLGDRLAYRSGPDGSGEGFLVGAHFVFVQVDGGKQVNLSTYGLTDVKLEKFLASLREVPPTQVR